MSALIPGEQRQDVLLHGAPMEDIDKCMDFGSIFFTNGQVTEDITSRINLARPAFPLYLVLACNSFAYNAQELPGSSALLQ